MTPLSTLPDPAPITRHLRSVYASRLLVAAVCHLRAFDCFKDGPLTLDEFQERLGLAERPSRVLAPALCAMGLLEFTGDKTLNTTPLARYLQAGERVNLIDYVALEKEDPGVLEMAERLRNDGPLNAEAGTKYVKDADAPSPMDDAGVARFLTLALAGRARLLAPVAARLMQPAEGRLLDVAGGTGLFACEWLKLNPKSVATVLDRPRVLDVAREFLGEFERDQAKIGDRIELRPGDMLEDELPKSDAILAASVFHDWPLETCRLLMKRFAGALKPGGRLWIHDAFLNDPPNGPLAVADYSAKLFWVTKGRCYSKGEYRQWMTEAGLKPVQQVSPTGMEYALISAVKPD